MIKPFRNKVLTSAPDIILPRTAEALEAQSLKKQETTCTRRFQQLRQVLMQLCWRVQDLRCLMIQGSS
jgi:hypothetical protein